MSDSNSIKKIVSLIHDGKKAELESLLSSDKELLTAGEQFGSWLHIAAECGQLEIVKYFVELGLDIDKSNENEERPPLILAIYSGNADIVAYLLAKGARVNVDRADYNPLFAAIREKQAPIAKMLIDAGIDLRKQYRDASGKPKDAASRAEDWGQKEIAEMIRTALSDNGRT